MPIAKRPPTRENGRLNVVGEAFTRAQQMHAELQAQTGLLTKLYEEFKLQAAGDEFKWVKANGVCDGSGNLTLSLENRLGYEAELVSWSAVAGAATNGGLVFYLHDVEAPNMLWSASITQYSSDKFERGMVIPVNGVIVAQFLAAGNGQQVFVNVLTHRVVRRITAPYPAEPKVSW